MLETQPYVKYDTRGESIYEYSISHSDDSGAEINVSVSDLRQDLNSDAEYMSDLFFKKIQDSPVLTDGMKEDFYKKAQVLVGMLDIERERQAEMENVIKGLNRIQSTQQEIETLTRQLDEVKQEHSDKSMKIQDQDQDKEI